MAEDLPFPKKQRIISEVYVVDGTTKNAITLNDDVVEKTLNDEVLEFLAFDNKNIGGLKDELAKLVAKYGKEVVSSWENFETKHRDTILHEILNQKRGFPLELLTFAIETLKLPVNIQRKGDGSSLLHLAIRQKNNNAALELNRLGADASIKNNSDLKIDANPHIEQIRGSEVQEFTEIQLERFLTQDMPKKPYGRRYNKLKSNYFDQNRSTMLSGIEFLTEYSQPGDTCLFVFLEENDDQFYFPFELFPDVSFILFPTNLNVSRMICSEKISIFPDPLSPSSAYEFKHCLQEKGITGSKMILFFHFHFSVSLPYPQRESLFWEKMQMQIIYSQIFNPKASSLLFNLPVNSAYESKITPPGVRISGWEEFEKKVLGPTKGRCRDRDRGRSMGGGPAWSISPQGKSYSQYLDGKLYLPVFGHPTYTDTRLVVHSESLSEGKEEEADTGGDNMPVLFKLKNYDIVDYEQQMFHFNSIHRCAIFEHGVEVTLQKDKNGIVLDHCYDCSAQIHILKKYLLKYYQFKQMESILVPRFLHSESINQEGEKGGREIDDDADHSCPCPLKVGFDDPSPTSVTLNRICSGLISFLSNRIYECGEAGDRGDKDDIKSQFKKDEKAAHTVTESGSRKSQLTHLKLEVEDDDDGGDEEEELGAEDVEVEAGKKSRKKIFNEGRKKMRKEYLEIEETPALFPQSQSQSQSQPVRPSFIFEHIRPALTLSEEQELSRKVKDSIALFVKKQTVPESMSPSSFSPNLDPTDSRNHSPRERVLLGDLELDLSKDYRLTNELMVFLSSTFDDTKFEQDALIERAFPRVREICASYHLNFQVISMRWGVRNRSINDHLVSELCMTLLEKCKNESQGIAYATFQSHRYGYRPIPPVIKKDLFEKLKSNNQSQPISSVDYFSEPYWKLDESVPPVYRLQPINSLPGCERYLISDEDKSLMKQDPIYLEHRNKEKKAAGSHWWDISEQMQIIFRSCAEAAFSANQISEEELRPFFISVTHEEVDRGIFKNDNRETQSLYFERTISGIDKGLNSSNVLDKSTAADYKEVQFEKQQEDLKEIIRRALPLSSVLSQVPWISALTANSSISTQFHPLDKKQPNEPEEWKTHINLICHQFVEGIKTSLKHIKSRPDQLLQEVLHHRNLVKTKRDTLGFDRTSILRAIQEYLLPDTSYGNRPFIVHGQSGLGKSWIMSHAISEAIQSRGTASGMIIFRMLGTSRTSSNVLELVQSISKQLMYNREESWNKIPQSWAEAKKWFSTGKPFQEETTQFIFLDSIDQLSLEYAPLRDLQSWLPGLKDQHPLPHNVRLVISTLPNDRDQDILGQFQFSMPDNLSSNFLQVEPLSHMRAEDSIRLMVERLPERGTICPVRRILTPSNLSLLVNLTRDSPSPLFLTVAIHLVSQLSSYSLPDSKIQHSHDVRDLIDFMYVQMEQKHGTLLVKKVLGCVAFCREGMGREELEDIVSLDDDLLEDVFEWWTPPVRRCPPLLVNRLIFDLENFVVERGATGGAKVWAWYHRQFWEVAGLRYESEKGEILTSISNYFGMSDLRQTNIDISNEYRNKAKQRQVNLQLLMSAPSLRFNDPTPRLNVRKLNVLTDSLLRGTIEEQLRLGELLTCDLIFLMVSIEAGMFYDLIEVLSTLMIQFAAQSANIPQQQQYLIQNLKSISKLLKMCGALSSDGGYNLKGSKQLPYQVLWRMNKDSSDSSSDSSSDTSSDSTSDTSSDSSSDTSSDSTSDSSSDSFHQPSNPLFSQCEDWVRSQNTRLIPQTNFSLNSVDTAFDAQLDLHKKYVSHLCQLSDGRLVSASGDNSIRIWDLTTRQCVRVLNLEGFAQALCELSDRRLAFCLKDQPNRLHTWDLSSENCEEIQINVDFSLFCQIPDQSRLLLALADTRKNSQNPTVCLWDLSSRKCETILQGHTGAVQSLCVLSDGRLASSSVDKTIRLWDLPSGECVKVLHGHTGPVEYLLQLSDKRLASCSIDGTVRLWDLETEFSSILCNFSMRSLYQLSNSDLACVSADSTIGILKISSGELLKNLKGLPSQNRKSICQLTDLRVTTVSNEKILLWDLDLFYNLSWNDASEGSSKLKGRFDVHCWLTDCRVASGSNRKNNGNAVLLWDLTSGGCTQLEGHEGPVKSLIQLSDGRLVSGSADTSLRLWDLSAGICVKVLQGSHTEAVCAICELQDGRLASGSWDKTVCLWDLSSEDLGDRVEKIEMDSEVTSLCQLSDGRLAIGRGDNTIVIMDLPSRAVHHVLNGHDEWVSSLTQLPDGRLASGSWDRIFLVWDLYSDCQGETLQNCFPDFRDIDHDITSLSLLLDSRYLPHLSFYYEMLESAIGLVKNFDRLHVFQSFLVPSLNGPSPDGHPSFYVCLVLSDGRTLFLHQTQEAI